MQIINYRIFNKNQTQIKSTREEAWTHCAYNWVPRKEIIKKINKNENEKKKRTKNEKKGKQNHSERLTNE